MRRNLVNVMKAWTLIQVHLQKTKFINKKYKRLKLLGSGDLKKKFDIELNSISKSAKEKIEKLGGKVILIK